MLKIKDKLLMINVAHQVNVGETVTATVEHQICLYKTKEGEVDVDVDFVDIRDVTFMGLPIGNTITEYTKFKEHMNAMGVDIHSLIDEECVGIISNEDVDALKEKYKNVLLG